MNAIEVDHLTKRFGELVAVNEVSFAVGDGEIFGLLGPNGAGKTTLIRMLTTLTPPTSGTARVAGYDIRKDANGVRESIGVIPQALTSDPELTAEENLLIHAKLYGVPAARRPGLIQELLQAVDLEKFGKELVRNFSGGMRRRLEIARGLVHSPKILFLDEPTTGLDPILATSIHQLIARTQQAFGFTGVVVSHTIPQVFDISDYVAILANGVIEEARPSKEFQASKNPIVQQFIRGETEGPIHVL